MKYTVRIIIVLLICGFLLLIKPTVTHANHDELSLPLVSRVEIVDAVQTIGSDLNLILVENLQTKFYLDLPKEFDEIWIQIGEESIKLNYDKDENLWFGVLNTISAGNYQSKVTFRNGEEYKEQDYLKIKVLEAGNIITTDILNNSPTFITIYKKNGQINDWELWNSSDYGFTNPARTNDDNKYAIILSEGEYFVKVEKEGYRTKYSDAFKVTDESIINQTIFLERSNIFDFIIQYFDTFTISPIEVKNESELSDFIIDDILVSDGINISKLAPYLDGKSTLVILFNNWIDITQIKQINSSLAESDVRVVLINFTNFENKRFDKVFDKSGIEYLNTSDLGNASIYNELNYLFVNSEGFVQESFSNKYLGLDTIIDNYNRLR